MFTFLGRFTTNHPWLVCAAWVLLAAGVAALAPAWDGRAQDDDVRFLPARCPSVRGYHLLEEAFPQDVFASRALFAVERAPKLTDDDLALVEDVVADLGKLSQEAPELQIKKIISHRDAFVGKRLLSADRQCVLIQVSLGTPYLALQTRATVDRAEEVVRQRLRSAGADAPAFSTTGPAGVGRDLTAAGGDSLERTTLATFVLVVVILLVVYRSPILALVPLVTIALAVWVALQLLALCTLIPGFYLVNVSQVFAVVMLYGAGTDYCLFLISRYREGLAAGKLPREALVGSVSGVGGALAASAGTVICGLGLMALAEFTKVRCGGPAIAVSIAVALLASLTLTPALLSVLGRAAFWPFGWPRPVPGASAEAGAWNWISRRVVARPVAVWATAILLLAPLAVVGLRVKSSYRATDELSPECSSVRGLAVIQRHFTAGEVGPITVLLESATDWGSVGGREVIEHLSKGFSHLDNVAEVRSLTRPLGEPLPPVAPRPGPSLLRRPTRFQVMWRKVIEGIEEKMQRSTRDHYVVALPGEEGKPRYVTRLDVVLRTDPMDQRSVPTLGLIQTWLREELPVSGAALGEVRSEVFGVTVNGHDLAEVTEADRTRINVLVLGAIFLILLVLVRRPGLAAYLLATVLLSYFATLGATTLAAHFWVGRPIGEVDWRVPFFLFTILVAVGEDYNILLMARALEERANHGGVEGTRRALAQTGGTITSCGLIMAGTFATLMLAGLNTLVQIGFALAFGVLLDTFVVRPFLVPAFAAWLWSKERGVKGEGPRVLRLPEVVRRRRAG